MKTRGWLCLIGLLVPAAAAGEPASAPTTLFTALWSKRSLLKRSDYRLLVVELPDGKSAAKLAGRKTLRLRAVADLRADPKGFKPETINVTVSLGSSRTLSTDLGKRHYLALVRRYAVRNKQMWQINYIHYVRKQVSSGRYTHSYYYLLPLDGPASPLAQAIADLIAGRGGRQAPGGKFQRMLDHIAGEDKQVRDFAASFASVNGWGYIGCPAQRAQPDAFAQALLAAGDRSTQRRMARAYSAARADLLPRDAKLLKQVFLHPDPEVVTPVLRGGLGRAAGRSDVLAPLVRPCLVDPGRNAQRRGDVLHALTQWQDKALLFRAELERIARGKPSPAPDYAHRLVALRLLLDAKVDNAHELVDHTLVGVPSAVALEYAVEHELRGIVPAAIRAVREGKLTWSQTHSSALSLLTRRFPEGTFEQFDGWWRRIESAGREKPMLASGFVNAELNARARKLIEQLGSGRYRHRRAARKQLTKLGTAIVPALRAATRHADRQIADSAGHLLARAEASFKSCRDRLAGAAKKERGGGLILQPAGAHPGTDQPKATSSPARKTAPPPP